MNYYERHLGDYSKGTAHLTMLEHGAYNLLLDRYYSTEQPIPADQAHRVARARTREEKQAVDVVLEEFFTLADGLWAHKRANEEIAKFLEKAPQAEEKRENDKERQRRARERRKALFAELNALGVTMPWNTTTEALQARLDLVKSQASHTHVTPPVTRDNTANQTPDTRHQTKAYSGDSTDSSSDAALPVSGNRIGGLCQRLRPLGINASPALFAKPGWAQVLARFDDEFIAAVVEQKLRASPGESFSAAYFLPVLIDIINNPSKPQSGGIHAERSNVLDQLTGRSSAAPELHTIDSEGNVIREHRSPVR